MKVENLKQCVDPEENELNNFTFSTDKNYLDISCEKRIPETYESALKRIPLDDSRSGAKKLRNSRSEVKISPNIKGLHHNYLQRRGDVSDTSLSEIDANKVNFNNEFR